MNGDSVENRAVAFVAEYYRQKGYTVENVCRARGQHAGYDLLVKNDTEELRLEVKGCTRRHGIPDPYGTEFDFETRLLIADFLCVVYYIDEQLPALAIIPREAIPPEFITPKLAYRISSKFKNAQTLNKFFVQT